MILFIFVTLLFLISKISIESVGRQTNINFVTQYFENKDEQKGPRDNSIFDDVAMSSNLLPIFNLCFSVP